MAKAKTIANKPEKDTNEALNPYTEINDTEKDIITSAAIKSGNNGLENRMIAVINIVKPVLIKIALTFRFKLPGMSPGAFKNAPTTIAGANSKYPKKLRATKGTTTANVSLMPL